MTPNAERSFCRLCLLALALSAAGSQHGRAQGRLHPVLWAAIGVPQPLYRVADTARLQVSFVVVNDGNAVADPAIGASHLFINGTEPDDWRFVINNGIRSSNFTALPPGDVLSFGYQLGPRYFGAAGVYTLRWETGGVRSPDLTFRVMQ